MRETVDREEGAEGLTFRGKGSRGRVKGQEGRKGEG